MTPSLSPEPATVSSSASSAMTLPQVPVRPVRGLGVALALAACDPAVTGSPTMGDVLTPLAAVVLAWWAAPPLVRRPVQYSARKAALLSQHRNTVFAVGCVVLAAFSAPPVWLASCVTALLLTYLLIVDACAAGPAGIRQLRSRHIPLTAYGASGLVLFAAFAPSDGSAWGPAVAVSAVCAAAYAVGTALWPRRPRRSGTPRSRDESPTE
ncbi:hypothetical protein G3I60_27765 [Streptomyces sp. SID13666]|uniref:hypothetical protein n=1 Tax=unclassified Streptomyces TaxID=2593676 RepID=UPI0013BFC8C4|nr:MULTISPECIES: hypothetical protein [unclassified Streptomyces]NEA57852.1 hypothetical protein [Streptomyces sp. SID13666]NEA75692.1 hypothetical protein [Streptomyces sp. SID13588]